MTGTHQKSVAGQIHFQILDDETNEVLRDKFLELGKVSDNQIVTVNFDEIHDSKDKRFTVRFSLRDSPANALISIYERNNTESLLKRLLRKAGVLTRGNILACNLLYSDQ
jgi:hypothetical protein